MMNKLQNYRAQIDSIDENLLELFAKRFKIVKEIEKYKKEQGLPVADKQRENQKLEVLMKKAEEYKLSSSFVKTVWTVIFKQAYVIEQ